MTKFYYGACRMNGIVFDWKREDRIDLFMGFVAPTVDKVAEILCKQLEGKEVKRHDFQSFGYVNIEIERESGDTWTEVYCIFPIKVYD